MSGFVKAKEINKQTHQVNGYSAEYIEQLNKKMNALIIKAKNRGQYKTTVRVSNEFYQTDLFKDFVVALRSNGYVVSGEARILGVDLQVDWSMPTC